MNGNFEVEAMKTRLPHPAVGLKNSVAVNISSRHSNSRRSGQHRLTSATTLESFRAKMCGYVRLCADKCAYVRVMEKNFSARLGVLRTFALRLFALS
jgi:hypothetical protein